MPAVDNPHTFPAIAFLFCRGTISESGVCCDTDILKNRDNPSKIIAGKARGFIFRRANG